jgi:alpha-glucosidase
MMNTLKWWQKTVAYQIYPKSFQDTTGSGQGDIPGITMKLDYLKTLGVGAVWLTPVYPSPMVDNGYDIADYTAIDPSYGTMADMETLIAEAKKRGIRIVMDLVYNHSSDQHAWFQESKGSRDNGKADWYIWRDARADGSAPTNWRGIFGGSAWTWCEERQQYYLHTFAAAQPDLNWANPAVRKALYQAANFWLDKGVGGFRIDAITYIRKPDQLQDGPADGKDGMVSIHAMTADTPGILDYLREFQQEVFADRDIFTVAEANGVGPDELKDWVGSQGVFDMLFEFSHMNLNFRDNEVWCYPNDWKLSELKKALSASQAATAEDGWYPIFFENHDQPRSVNKFFPEGADPELAAKALGTVLLTLRGTPFIYEGQELGLTNVAWDSIDCYDDISSHGQYGFALEEGFTSQEALDFVHRFSRDNARTPMQWSDRAAAGFTVGKPWLPVHPDYAKQCVVSEAKDENSVLSYYRYLSRLRREGEVGMVLQQGDYQEFLADHEQIYAFRRTLGGQHVDVLVNFTLEKAAYDLGGLQDSEYLVGNYAEPEKGYLRPLEAVIYCHGTRR